MRRLWYAIGAATLAVAVASIVVATRDGDEAESPVVAAAPSTIVQLPGDEPDGVPSALEDMTDDAFPEPLVDPDDIRSGGPPPDGIPPLDDPRFEPASSVTWLTETEPVLALEVGGEARAYPVQVMTWHEIVNDTFGDTPVTVSYCPLCNSAVAYDRRVDDRVLDFGTSGRLLNSSLVMYDRQTESLWSHFTGQAIVGALTGAVLDTLPVSTISWQTFRTAHPDGRVLSRDTGFDRDYGRNPYPGYDDIDRPPFLFDGVVDGRLAAQTRVVAVRGETESVVVALDELAEVGVLHATLDGEPIVIVHEPGTASALDADSVAGGRDVGATGVFRPSADGNPLSLERAGGRGFLEADSGTTFDVLGRGTGGRYDGVGLDLVAHLDTFWFAIAAFEPNVRLLEA